jgi:acid-sensing ion channel, other
VKAKSRKTDDALREFSPESRKCYFEGEKPLKFFKTYTKLNCEWECKTNDILQDCDCVLYNMPRDIHTKVCDIIQTKNCDPNPSECNCYAPCNDLIYELTSENMPFLKKYISKYIRIKGLK